ncbi:MAG: cytoplasmic protein, partial [Candidatus Heimdallarchaeota archaeon]|nr:cytoplasmic protein [Candidatus Heimdallarchaeota archaeon]
MEKMLFVIWTANKGIFTHVMMNVLDFKEKGYEVGVVFESEG